MTTSNRPKYLRPGVGRGKELTELMRKELGISPDVKWFEVRFAAREVITVTCEFYAREHQGETPEEARP